jgi:hypothetical protein
VSITIAAEFIPPDHVSAVIARLRDVTNILALCGDITVKGKTVRRIGGEFHPTEEPRNWLTVTDAGGFPAEMPLARPRVSIYHYAASGVQAAALARLVQAALVPLDRQDTLFVAAGCVVTDVQRAGGVIPLPLPPELRDWHCRVVDYLLLVNQAVRPL